MSTLTSKYDLTKVDPDRYWRLVHLTLSRVFDVEQGEATPLETEVKGSSPDEQLLFYHSEALSTAADIAERVPTVDEIEQYKKLRAAVYENLLDPCSPEPTWLRTFPDRLNRSEDLRRR